MLLIYLKVCDSVSLWSVQHYTQTFLECKSQPTKFFLLFLCSQQLSSQSGKSVINIHCISFVSEHLIHFPCPTPSLFTCWCTFSLLLCQSHLSLTDWLNTSSHELCFCHVGPQSLKVLHGQSDEHWIGTQVTSFLFVSIVVISCVISSKTWMRKVTVII